ncbi:MAG: hypothetical protein A2798_01890 [Candidatus Levybacteria bacterium RIFCSPHIGHO2_01_FULL_37_17]|nr:MAG: hypothetical protein A2798_01890 [Candidatus Levybacteria bacterium RIFCSPHIGHO2_01_FULL_37_17]
MDVSVVIPNYQGQELLKNNLPKLIKELENYKDLKTEIILVDDGSTDNSVNTAKSFPRVKVLQNEKNSGFSTTVNKGVRQAKGKILLLLNTDVYPESGFLTPLLKHFRDESIFAVGCMDKSNEGRGMGLWRRGFLVHQKGEIDKNDTLWVSGGSGAFRKSIWDKLGGLRQIYSPFYWEDIDLSYRAQKAGYKVLFEKDSVVYHEHDKGAIKKKFSAGFVRGIVFRNQFIFVWINLTDRNLMVGHFLWLPYHFVKTLLNLDFAFYLGFFKALLKLPEVLKVREENKKLFKLTDRAVVERYS